MSPLPGIIASQMSGHLWAPAGAYDALASVTLSASASSITFAGIPSGYKHLQIRAIARCNYSAEILDTYWTFNGTSSNYYGNHQIRGNGSSATAGADSRTDSSTVFVVPGTATTSNIFGTAVVDILDYANTNKNKTLRSLGGIDANGSGSLWFRSSLWMNTSAITAITISAETTSSFITYSSFALYGVK